MDAAVCTCSHIHTFHSAHTSALLSTLLSYLQSVNTCLLKNTLCLTPRSPLAPSSNGVLQINRHLDRHGYHCHPHSWHPLTLSSDVLQSLHPTDFAVIHNHLHYNCPFDLTLSPWLWLYLQWTVIRTMWKNSSYSINKRGLSWILLAKNSIS